MALSVYVSVVIVMVVTVRSSTNLQELIYDCNVPPSCINTDLHRLNYSLYTDYERNTCCLGCTCSEDCKVKRDCCYDANVDFQTDKKYRNERKETCVQTVTNNVHRLHPLYNNSFLMIDGCPPGYTGDVVESCLNNTNTDIMHTTPVYSDTTVLNYKNTFCAYCNGETEELVPWLITTNCLSYIYNTELTDEKDCFAYWSPAVPENATPCYSETLVISHCPSNTKSPYAKLCEEQPYIPIQGYSAWYKNKYCFYCSKHITVTLDPFCIRLVAIPVKGLSFILGEDAFRITSKIKTTKRKLICKAGLTYVKELVSYFPHFIVSSLIYY